MTTRSRIPGVLLLLTAAGALAGPVAAATRVPKGQERSAGHARATAATGASGPSGSTGATGPQLPAPPPPPGEELPGTALDIVIALDTTGSMSPSIDQARRDAAQIVHGTQERLPGARFSVVEFKDSGDEVEYRVAEPMTTQLPRLQRALRSLSASGGGDAPEAYNLLFSRVVDDPSIGFRPGARRLLFVLGDASPHGAAHAELPGCDDETPDPHELTTQGTLSGLRRAQVTVHMVLQASSASTTLRCYRSIAGLGYGTGLATASGAGRGGDDDGAAPGPRGAADLAELVDRAIGSGLPALDARPPATTAPGERDRYGLTLVNRLPRPVRLQEVSLVLPSGFRLVPGSAAGVTRGAPERSGDRLVWPVDVRLEPRRRTVFAVRLQAGGATGVRRRIPFRATFLMPDGGVYVARSRATVRVSGAGR